LKIDSSMVMLHSASYQRKLTNGQVEQFDCTEGNISFTEVKTGVYSGTFDFEAYDPAQKKIVRLYEGYFNGLIRK
jgi:hypothetical protein